MATQQTPLQQAEAARQENVTFIVTVVYNVVIGGLVVAYALAKLLKRKFGSKVPHTSPIPGLLYRPLMPNGPGVMRDMHLGKLLVIAGLVGLNLLFILVEAVSPRNGLLNRTSTVLTRVGAMTVAHIPIVVALVGKNNPVSFITGLPYLELRFMHKTLGFIAGLEAFAHGIGYAIMFDVNQGVMRAAQTITQTPVLRGGVIAVTGMITLWLSGQHFMRIHVYEMFLLLHFIGIILTIVGLFMHFPFARRWIIAAPILLIVELVLLFFKTVYTGGFIFRSPVQKARLSLVGDAIVARIPMPKAAQWGPGQHAYISFHHKRFFGQSHPFSIANVSRMNVIENAQSNDMLFVIKIRDGITRQLRDFILEAPSMTRSLKVTVNGIYNGHDESSYVAASRLITLAVGSGITHTFSIIQDSLCMMLNRETARLSDVRFVWVLRNIDQVSWIAQDLQTVAVMAANARLPFQFDIFITSSNFTESTSRILKQAEVLSSGYHRAYQLVDLPSSGSSDDSSVMDDSSEKVIPAQPFVQSLGQQVAQLRDGPEIAAAVAGLSGVRFPLNVAFHKGKPDLPEVLRSYVLDSNSPVSVHVCGPKPFVNDISSESFDLQKVSPLDLRVASFEC